MESRRKQFGVFVDGLGMSQLTAEMAYSINNKIDELDYDFCLFFDRVEQIYNPINAPKFLSSSIPKFSGDLITTSLQTTRFAIKNKFWQGSSIWYYVYNLEWTYKDLHLGEVERLLKESKLICRCKDHAEHIIEKFGIKPLMIANIADITGIINGIRGLK